MIELGKPVLPLDLKLGSTANDEEGAVALHRQMTTEPDRFFPSTHEDVVNRVGLLSLERGINDAATVARASAEMLARELEAVLLSGQPTNLKGAIGRRVASRESAPHCHVCNQGHVRNQDLRMVERLAPLHVAHP